MTPTGGPNHKGGGGGGVKKKRRRGGGGGVPAKLTMHDSAAHNPQLTGARPINHCWDKTCGNPYHYSERGKGYGDPLCYSDNGYM